MDRGGGGGPPRKGSSLPRTLHGSLLQPGSHAIGSVFTEEPQAMSETEGGHHGDPEYATHSTHSARFTPVPSSSRDPPTFEEGSSRGTVGAPQRGGSAGSDRPFDEGRAVQYPSHLYQSSYRSHVGSTDPTSYAYSQHPTSYAGSTQFYSYPPPTQTRLPPVRALEQEVGISSPAPSPRYSSYRAEAYRPEWSHHDPRSQRLPGGFWDEPEWETAYRRQEIELSTAIHETFESQRIQPWIQVPRAREEPSRDARRSTSAHQTVSAARLGLPEPPTSSYHTQPSYLSAASSSSSVTYHDTSFLPHLQPFHEQTHEQTQHLPPPSRRPAPETPPIPRYGHYIVPHETPERTPRPYREESTPLPLAEAGAPSQEEVVSGGRPPARPPEPSRPAKRKGRDDDDDDDDDDSIIRPRKVARKTPIACFFCRGRKLKCDGQIPMCTNCVKRSNPCSYAPYPKRRGPGKAPKGQRKVAALKSSGPSGASSGYASATSTEQDIRLPRKTEEMTTPNVHMYSPYPEPPFPLAAGEQALPVDLHLPPIQPSYATNQPPHSGFPYHLQYPIPAVNPAAAPPGDPRVRDMWRRSSEGTITALVSSRDEGSNGEGSSKELYDLSSSTRRGGPRAGQLAPPPHPPRRERHR